MGYGLATSAANNAITHFFSDLIRENKMRIYVDNVIFVGTTFDEYKEIFRKILERLSDAQLLVSPRKTYHLFLEMTILGHTVTDQGDIRPDHQKLETITQSPKPTTIKQLQSFLSAASWFRKFIRCFPNKGKILYGMIKKTNQIHSNGTT